MRTIRNAAATLAAALALVAGGAQAQEIKVGGIFDLTGVTSDVGKPYAQGVQDHVAFINSRGGINGKKITLLSVDYGYKIPEAVSAYKRMLDEKVIMVNGWGTGDTLALKDFVNKDKVPYFSASFAGDLTDPSKTPYNFFVGTSYGDSIRAAMQFVKDTWTDPSRAPKVVFIFPDHPYGKNPIPAGTSGRSANIDSPKKGAPGARSGTCWPSTRGTATARRRTATTPPWPPRSSCKRTLEAGAVPGPGVSRDPGRHGRGRRAGALAGTVTG